MIYILYKVSFDISENHLHNALKREIVGYAEDETEVKFFMDYKSKCDPKYRGWDNIEYPIYNYEKINQL